MPASWCSKLRTYAPARARTVSSCSVWPEPGAAPVRRFLADLSLEQREQATFKFEADERMNWHYIPRERKGLPIKAMSEGQRKLARDLLGSGLSQRGYVAATAIMDLEAVLGDLE